MAIALFKAFRSTVTMFAERMIKSTDRWLTDPSTGAIVGVQNQNANGPDARFVPVDINATQLAAPTAEMLADLDATYRLNVAPYPRYQSNGARLISAGAEETQRIVPKGFVEVFYSPLTIATPQELVVEGTAYVRALPA